MLADPLGQSNSSHSLSLASTLNSSKNSSRNSSSRNSSNKQQPQLPQLENNMNTDEKPPVSGKLLDFNVTSEEIEVEGQLGVPEQSLDDNKPAAGQLSAEETQLLLQKLSINNPFYRFRKQSNSLRELRRLRRRARRQLRRHRSEADLVPRGQQALHSNQHQHQHNEAKVVVVLDSKQHLALSSTRHVPNSIKTRSVSSLMPDNSTVITNPFSIFHDDEILTLGVNPRLRSANSAATAIRTARPQRSAKGLRRLFERSTNPPPQYLHGVPVRRFERQDFHQEPVPTTDKPKRGKAIFKQLSLRRLHKSEEPPALPKLKLSYRYPNRTQSIQSMRAAGSGGYDIQHTAYRPRLVSTAPKSNYFERLQAKTRQGIQKIRDKCRNFKASNGDGTTSEGGGGSEFSGFHTLAKDDSFRFISDRANISSYESRCAAAHAAGKQATIYKSYKSEIDLSKNLHYLEHYLEQNFEQQLGNSRQSAHSVGRISGAQRRALASAQRIRETETETETDRDNKPAAATPRRRHKRSQSQANGGHSGGQTANYENLGTLPISARAASRNRSALHSDSLSSSDYASVFSGPTAAKRETVTQSETRLAHVEQEELRRDREQESVLKLRYEHPDKMCEYYFENLTSYALALEESEDLLLAESAKSARFFYGNADEDVDNDPEEEEEDDDEVLAANEADYLARDIRIRVNVNECEDGTDWYQRQQQQQQQEQQQQQQQLLATSYNENLAESTFYQSLNQHLQRQAIAVDDRQKSETAPGAETALASLGGESYLAHFQRSRSDFDRIERSSGQPLFERGEYYGFGGDSDVVYATKQRRADLMEAHYSRSYPTAGAAAAGRQLDELESRDSGPASYKRSSSRVVGTPTTTTGAGVAAMSTSNFALSRTANDALYATSSKQQQLPVQPEPAAFAVPAAAATPTTSAAAAAAAAATPSAGNTNTNTSANNRYILENLRKYYANQHQHPPAHSVNSSSLSNSSSSNSSMSQQQKLHLPTATQPHLSKQQQHQQQLHLGAPPRRNSSTSNASSTADNFDTFIALRNASTTSTAASSDYMAPKQQQQQQPHQPPRRHQREGAAGKAPLISALNYYGHGLSGGSVLTYNGKLSATAMLSQVNLGRSSVLHQQHGATPAGAEGAARAAGTSAASPAASASASASESFILEYEC